MAFWYRVLGPITFCELIHISLQNPSDHDWFSLNPSVHGHLYEATPYALPCFSSYNGRPYPGSASACSTVQSNYLSAPRRTDFFGAYMNSQDEVCLSDDSDQCLLDGANPQSPISSNRTCYQGNIPSFYIDVGKVEDIIIATKFAKEHGLILSIKNAGHDYLTRSSLKGSLSL